MNYMVLKSGSFYVPKHSKSKPLGQDAHFICDDKCTIGVADGVGGLIKHGIDSGIYARELMSHSVKTIQDRFSGDVVVPMEVLCEAYSKTEAKGASTACIITLDKGNYKVNAVNIGDSGFIIIRGGRTVYSSPIQQNGFNCPYQLGNRSKSSNPTSLAEEIQVEVEIGDVIVAGSDGLFDNVFIAEIESIVWQLGYVVEPQQMALKIAEHAYFNSHNATITSPFDLDSAEAGHQHNGGKKDDITVVVSYVIPIIE